MTRKLESKIAKLTADNEALRRAMLQLLLIHHTRAEMEARGNLPISEVKCALRKIDPKIQSFRDLRNIAPKKALPAAQALWELADEIETQRWLGDGAIS